MGLVSGSGVGNFCMAVYVRTLSLLIRKARNFLLFEVLMTLPNSAIHRRHVKETKLGYVYFDGLFPTTLSQEISDHPSLMKYGV